MNIVPVPQKTAAELEREADLEEARAQEQHAREMQALAHEIAGWKDTLLDPSDFLEMARQSRVNAALLREQARRR